MSEKTERLLNSSWRDICYQCFINKQKNLESLLKVELKNIFGPIEAFRIENYSTLTELSKEKYLVCLNAWGKITLHLLIYLSKEFKTFSLKVDSKILQKLRSSTFDFS
jgi:hypothetical protein